MSFVIFVNGLAFLFFAILMILDAAIFPATGSVFLFSGMLCGIAGGMTAVAGASDWSGFRRLHAFLLTSTTWVSAALAGAMPLWLWGLTPVDAVFESMSGITTTGSTVMTGLDTTPKGVLFWRALLQGIGGVGFIVTGMALLPMLRVGGMQLFRTESSDQADKELKSASRFALATLIVYLGLILICAVIYALGGMTAFDAITHAMTTLATGGYSNYDASFGHFESPFLQWSATVFMVLGALPFVWYIRVYTRRSLRSEQIGMMMASLILSILAISLWLALFGDQNFFVAMRLVAFNVVSVVTTTGYATTDYTAWGSLAVAIFFMLTAVGGCTGSTGGGIKAMRWIVMARVLKAEIARIYQPHIVKVIRYEGRVVEQDVLSGVISFVTIYFATFVAMSFVLNLVGVDFTSAVSGTLQALGNVGPGVGPIIGPAGNFSTLSDPAKLILSLGMYLGRLEILTVFIVFMPGYWRSLH
ncbi:TrkH family potassium uptake protein [Paracoccus alkanivorans]|uniref:Trk system potassium uptake protein n=1 Tax=Paracoccus alkanivorans TaxID=2116655 RepID=A0A3M0MMF5_9RHOB|nr:TrkH family potassium uptake protein [Paracoccus alkanivorans]RMC32467.1 TrkH family potassium uptake protein [Paracoccus alkanivorans]